VKINTLEGIHSSLTLNHLFQDGSPGLGRNTMSSSIKQHRQREDICGACEESSVLELWRALVYREGSARDASVETNYFPRFRIYRLSEKKIDMMAKLLLDWGIGQLENECSLQRFH